LQQVNANFQGRKGLAGAVMQVTSYPAPFLILNSEKSLRKALQLRGTLQNQQFELRAGLPECLFGLMS